MKKANNELLSLMNVGKAVFRDLQLLKINSVAELAKQEASALFDKLQRVTCMRQDPCMWDVFASIINEAKTGKKTKWFEWTKVRKKKFPQGFKKP